MLHVVGSCVVNIFILADCPGTREALYNTGSRHDSRIPGYPSTRCEPYNILKHTFLHDNVDTSGNYSQPTISGCKHDKHRYCRARP